MINVKKGTAHSLQQSDMRGNNTGATIYAGLVCHVDTSGNVVAGGDGTTGLRGFAINNSADGDAIESGKIALYSLDGNSVIETDQVDLVDNGGSTPVTLTAANYAVGVPVYANASTGKVTLYPGAGSANGAAIGWVEGVRSLQNATPYPSGVLAGSQNYPSLLEQYNGTPVTKSYNYKAQVNVPVLGIKLAAGR